LADLTPQHDDFHTIVFIEVDMHGTDDLQQMRMLKAGELFHQLRRVVVVHEANGGNGPGFGITETAVAYLPTYKVAHGLGAALITLLSDKLIESRKQFFIERYSDSLNVTHFSFFLKKFQKINPCL
jgi:hypothetical protein